MTKPILNIVKTGGKIVEDEAQLDVLLSAFAEWRGAKVLVHGGGSQAASLSARLGIAPRMHEGRRITDADTLNVVTMVYGGLLNKQVVAALQSKGCDALGMTGADANTIPARRRPAGAVDWGFVGDPDPALVNVQRLQDLLSIGLSPVFAALTHDGKGQVLNTNADTIASSLAIALSAHYSVDLWYCFEKPGVLANPADDASVITEITPGSYAQLKADKVVTDGMLPKLDNAFAALHAGVLRVRLGDTRFLNDPARGTTLSLS